MSDLINDLDDDIELKDSNVGKRAFFINTHEDPNRVFTFSSSIENIGINHDRQLKNFTEVTIISDEQKAHHPIIGDVFVTKVMVTDSMWIPTVSLVIITDNKNET